MIVGIGGVVVLSGKSSVILLDDGRRVRHSETLTEGTEVIVSFDKFGDIKNIEEKHSPQIPELPSWEDIWGFGE